jgi:hypothetical protein
MKRVLFQSNFYVKFKAPNSQDLINYIESIDQSLINNQMFDWGTLSSSDKIALKSQELMEFISPNINELHERLKNKFSYILYDPWLNLYKRKDFQEIHAHHPRHLSSVFFANDGEGFSKFYFSDRHSNDTHPKLDKLIGYKAINVVEYEKGDILFFPSHILHGLSSHNSDVIRKTLSFNFDILD